MSKKGLFQDTPNHIMMSSDPSTGAHNSQMTHASHAFVDTDSSPMAFLLQAAAKQFEDEKRDSPSTQNGVDDEYYEDEDDDFDESASNPGKRRNRGRLDGRMSGRIAPFPSRLFDMITCETLAPSSDPPVLAWLSNGKGFTINDERAFLDNILPLYKFKVIFFFESFDQQIMSEATLPVNRHPRSAAFSAI